MLMSRLIEQCCLRESVGGKWKRNRNMEEYLCSSIHPKVRSKSAELKHRHETGFDRTVRGQQ